MRGATDGQAKVATNHTAVRSDRKREEKNKKITAMLLTVTQPCSPNALFFDVVVVVLFFLFPSPCLTR